MSREKASHHHDASGNESENHNQVQAVPQWTGEAFKCSRPIGKRYFGSEADKKQEDQKAGQLPQSNARLK